MMNDIELSVIIPTHRDAECLEIMLRSLTRQTLAPERFEVIVVRDGDYPGYEAAEEAGKPLDLQLITLPERRGRSAARNHGIARARGRVILFLDADSHASPELLQRHLGHHSNGPRVVVGRRLEMGPPQMEAIMRGEPAVDVDLLCDDTRFPSGDHEIPMALQVPWMIAWAANVSVPRDLVVAVDGFDEAFGTTWGWEDPELFYRIYMELSRNAEAFTYDHAALCHHLPHYRQIGDWYKDYEENLSRVKRKHPHLVWELTGWRSSAETAIVLAHYQKVIAEIAESGVGRIAPVLPWVTSRLEALGAARVVWMGSDTESLPIGGETVTFDFSRPPSATNFHLLGAAMPLEAAGFDAVVNVDVWQHLGRSEFYNLVDESVRVAGTLLLVIADIPESHEVAMEKLVFFARGLGNHFRTELLAGDEQLALQIQTAGECR
ncbi:glycosyltransferase family 2 protein [Nonomuraea sp. SYSU D8015]|uniref:glycosyltransferase family 2 protein n=1 Tax=Nonomuraea sp. SYSU D8015 TaxID=2593644 RepID=UPI00166126F9|nr:glycosyltransferase [Nonomuraea sp. SYSU D8015]